MAKHTTPNLKVLLPTLFVLKQTDVVAELLLLGAQRFLITVDVKVLRELIVRPIVRQTLFTPARSTTHEEEEVQLAFQ